MKRLRNRITLIVTTLTMIVSVSLPNIPVSAAGIVSSSATTDLFGGNVYIFDPSDSNTEIQSTIDAIFAKQETNQFGSERAAMLFKPGNYDNVRAKVGFYTQVAGLGKLPTDTSINEFDCNANWMGGNATCNFWRSAENFTVKKTATWAAAQATSLRRMQFNEWLGLDQWGQGWASGGFVADTVVKGTAAAYSEQQYMSRNSNYGAWAGGVWNAVFVGMKAGLKVDGTNTPVQSNWDTGVDYQNFTTVNETPLIKETPFLTVDGNDKYSVFVPSVRENAKGTSWENGSEGTSIGIDKFYIAKPEKDTADSINAALASGKNLILTPGIYNVDKAIKVNNANTIVLGLGYATLRPTGMNSCLEVADVDGAIVSGLMFDAGPSYTENLLKVGENGSSANHAANPTLLSDLSFRVGGVTSSVAQSKTCVTINSNNVIGDNFWVWRADHGDGVGWDLNKAQNGVVINGDYVTMYGLFVEHFQEYQTVWNGENGRNYFYQSEIPYDVPSQESWKSHNGTANGYASYKVGDDVTSHEAYGLGIYSYNRDATIDLNSAAEVPDRDGVYINNICSVMLAGNPGISHVINNTGGAVTVAGQRQQVVTYGSSNGIKNPTGPTNPTTGVNLALNKTVYASSGTNSASSATDGKLDSRWESDFSDGQWMYVDLGAVYSIDKVKLAWETAAGKDYTIQVSNDAVNWTTVYTRTNGTGGTEELTLDSSAQGRYVRMNGSTRTTGYGFSIWEFEVYGESADGNEPTNPAGENLALNKNATVSSMEGNFVGTNAVDGNINSRWSSNAAENQWINVDLGSTKSISKVALNWEVAYAKGYKIEVSTDGSNWTSVYQTTNSDGGNDEVQFNSVNARYVRVYGTERATGYGISLWELGIYK